MTLKYIHSSFFISFKTYLKLLFSFAFLFSISEASKAAANSRSDFEVYKSNRVLNYTSNLQCLDWSGTEDSNLRPHGPKPRALAN